MTEADTRGGFFVVLRLSGLELQPSVEERMFYEDIDGGIVEIVGAYKDRDSAEAHAERVGSVVWDKTCRWHHNEKR